MQKELFFIVMGYLSGSILFANVAAKLFGKQNMLAGSEDGNPGTSNAFQYGGFCCGLTTLLGDLAKGILPVYLYLYSGGSFESFHLLKPLIIAAPVLGHAFPILYRFQGGKGIAVSFGCLLGLLPMWRPAAALAASYIFFSTVLRINPHMYRTVAAYTSALGIMLITRQAPVILLGFTLVSSIVFLRHQFSDEPHSEWRVKLLWMR